MEFTLADHYKLIEGLPPGTWVMVSTRENRVLSTEQDVKKAVAEAREQGEESPLIMCVPMHHGLQCL